MAGARARARSAIVTEADDTMTEPLRVIVVGLGKAGSRFDEEPGRQVVWSHVGAYLARPNRFIIVGGCDPDPLARDAFARRCPSAERFDAVDDLVDNLDAEVASICTPPEFHAAMVQRILDLPSLRVVWCEKPLTLDLAESQAMVEACAARDVVLIVSYARRWLPLWRRAAEAISDGAIGTPVCVRVAMPNRLWSVTSHAVDLAQFFGGVVEEVQSFDLPTLFEDGEPARAAFLRFVGGAYGIVQVIGRRDGLLVEVEVTGSDGRLIANEQSGTLRIERFVPSERYEGYRELEPAGEEQLGNPTEVSHFLAIGDEVAELATGARRTPTCSGADALAVQRVLGAMAAAGEKFVGRGAA